MGWRSRQRPASAVCKLSVPWKLPITSLLVRLRDPRDSDAWATADRLYRPIVVGYARARGLSQPDAEDVAQQCLQAVLAQISSYQHQGSFRVWLRAIATHKISDLFARRRGEVRADTSFVANQIDSQDAPDELWDRAWWAAHLRHCVDAVRLEVAQNTYAAFVAYAIEGEEAAAVAQRLGMSTNQVYVTKHRVVKRVRELLIQLIGDEAMEFAA